MAERTGPEVAGKSRRALRIGTNVAIVAFGIFVLAEALKMPLGDPANPKAGFWPVMISGTFVFLAVLLLFTERDDKDYVANDSSSGGIGLAILSLGLFIFLFSMYGFIVPGFVLMVFWLRSLGRESWLSTIATAVLLVAGFYILFVRILEVPFPEGLLGVAGV